MEQVQGMAHLTYAQFYEGQASVATHHLGYYLLRYATPKHYGTALFALLQSYMMVFPNVKGAEGSTFYFNAIKEWNKLPMELKTCENTASFKRRLKKHLLQTAAEEVDRDFVFF